MAAMPGRVFAEAKVAPIVPFKVHISDTVLHDLTVAWIKQGGQSVRRQRSLDRPGGLNKGEFLAHRNVHRSEDETANPTIEGTG